MASSNTEQLTFSQRLLSFTETMLTKRSQKRMRRKARDAKKHPVLDWVEAFLWAAMVVLVVNQFALQAYLIPSPSMEKTLLVGDHIFVDKFTFGPELLPGIGKLPGIDTPERTDVMCFENPSYKSNGPAFMVLQRLIYMLTLSMVDIDRFGLAPGAETPGDKMYLLIKRVAGVAGDQWRFVDGDFQVKAPGESWMSESHFKQISGFSYQTERSVTRSAWDSLYFRAGERARQIVAERNPLQNYLSEEVHANTFIIGSYHRLMPIFGQDRNLSQLINGWYVPEGYIFPLGDNRDNSRDGRYFGPVPKSKVLGRALFIYWPFNRIGGAS